MNCFARRNLQLLKARPIQLYYYNCKQVQVRTLMCRNSASFVETKPPPVLTSNKLLSSKQSFPGVLLSKNGFKTSAPQRVPPLLVALIKPVSRILAMVLGRRFRTWWRKLPHDHKLKVKAFSRQNSRSWGTLGVLLVALVAYGYESHLEECPITHRRRFVALRKDQMEKIADAEFEELLTKFENELLPEHHPYYDRVARVATRILKANQELPQVKEKNWTISVIGEDERNAFVLPSGNIFVYTGMLSVCENDDQLGVVLSHEIAHTLLGHAAENLSYLNLLSALLIVPLGVAWAFLPNDGIAIVANWFFTKVSELLFELPFARHMETEADEVGLDLASKACFDVREAPVFWGKMEVVANLKDDMQPPEFLSTHPSHNSRQEYLASLLPGALRTRSTCGCPKLGPNDPNDEFQRFLKAVTAQSEKVTTVK